MPYKVCGTKLTLEGVHTDPILILSSSRADILEKVCSYLNQLEDTHNFWKIKTKELLCASLDGKGLNKIQNVISKMLNYPGLDEFIKETYVITSKEIIESDLHKPK